MTRGLSATAVTALVLLAGSESASARNTCPQPRGYSQVAASGEARVFERGGSAYGCHVSRDRVVGLGIAGLDYWLAGRYVLRWWRYCCAGDEPTEYTIAASDLRSGRFTDVLDIWGGGEDREDTPAIARQAVIARNGSFAWIACTTPPGPALRCRKGAAGEYRLWRWDSRGDTLLDEGDGDVLSDLRRDGRRLTWRHGDERISATLK